MVVHTFNPSAREAEAGGSLWVWGQPGLQELVLGWVLKPQKNPVSKNQEKKEKRIPFLKSCMQKCRTYLRVLSKDSPVIVCFGSLWTQILFSSSQVGSHWARHHIYQCPERESLLVKTLRRPQMGKMGGYFQGLRGPKRSLQPTSSGAPTLAIMVHKQQQQDTKTIGKLCPVKGYILPKITVGSSPAPTFTISIS